MSEQTAREGTPAFAEPSTNDLCRWWWLHDAQWYQGVARRFGPEAANEINQEAMRLVAERVARDVAKRLGRPVSELAWKDVVEVFSSCPKRMWPEGMAYYEYEVTGPGRFEVEIKKSFNIAMLRRAGSLETYRCPCLQMREGWFAGLGLEPCENKITQCVLDGAATCKLKAEVSGYEPADGGEA